MKEAPPASDVAQWSIPRYTCRTMTDSFVEGASRELCWSQLGFFTEIPSKGRSLFKGSAREKNEKFRNFSAFARQAKAYDDAAALTNGPSRSLLTYYCLMNLAKAELLRSHPAQMLNGKIGHGLSVKFSNSTELNGDFITVYDGIFSMLYEARTGAALPKGTKFRARRLFSQVPELGSNARAALEDVPKVVPFGNVHSRGDGLHWHLAMTPDAIGYSDIGKHTTRLFQSHFKPVGPPSQPWRTIFGVSARAQLPRPIFFESPKYSSERAANIALRTALGRILEPTLRSDFEFQLSASLVKASGMYLPSDLARYVLFYYASSLVRYRPARVDIHLGGKTSWLISSLAHESHLPSLISNIGGAIDTDLFFASPLRS